MKCNDWKAELIALGFVALQSLKLMRVVPDTAHTS